MRMATLAAGCASFGWCFSLVAAIRQRTRERAQCCKYPTVSHDHGLCSLALPSACDNLAFSVRLRRQQQDERAAGSANEPVFLCWVAEDGQLFHFYELQHCSRHDECTAGGHAFVLFQGHRSRGCERPTSVFDISDQDFLCAVRMPERVPVDSTVLLKVNIDIGVDVDTDAGADAVAIRAGGHCTCRGRSRGRIAARASCVLVPKPDDEYRIIVRAPRHICERQSSCCFPPATEDWEVRYRYLVPALPSSGANYGATTGQGKFDATTHTVYQWGDIDFDDYGCNGRHPISEYPMNQIVPQVMIGNCLAASGAGGAAGRPEGGADAFEPRWECFNEWVLQAQYFWMAPGMRPKAMCGQACTVRPGTEVLTTITYRASSGDISVEICETTPATAAGKLAKSSIVIPRPFPDASPPAFDSWREFFERGAAASCTAGPLARPMLNVEYKGAVDVETLRSMCPFRVLEATVPTMPPQRTSLSAWRVSLFSPRTGEGDELSAQPPHAPIEDGEGTDSAPVATRLRVREAFALRS